MYRTRRIEQGLCTHDVNSIPQYLTKWHHSIAHNDIYREVCGSCGVVHAILVLMFLVLKFCCGLAGHQCILVWAGMFNSVSQLIDWINGCRLYSLHANQLSLYSWKFSNLLFWQACRLTVKILTSELLNLKMVFLMLGQDLGTTPLSSAGSAAWRTFSPPRLSSC